MAEPVALDGRAGTLVGHLSLPIGAERAAGVVLCHGFPSAPRGARASGEGYAELADHLAAETGAAVLTFAFRGCATSEGDFSVAGWVEDLRDAVKWLTTARAVPDVAVAGFSAGGAVALCAAAQDQRIGAVACFAAPAGFDDWAAEPRPFLERCRELGVIRTKGFPVDFDAWAEEFSTHNPCRAVGAMGLRPALLVHGSDDDVVDVSAARTLSGAAGEAGAVDVRVLAGAGHRLRYDPRAIAVLIGWISRRGATP